MKRQKTPKRFWIPGLALLAAGLALLVITAMATALAAAAPLPPRIAVNHQTHECARVLPGDECSDAVLPPDWEYLPQGENQCPADYKEVALQFKWSGLKEAFCCTQYHSGSPGDCADVIVQQAGRQCAFVDDLAQCASLPEGWQAWGQYCPEGFTWTENQVCPAAPPGTPTAEIELTPPASPTPPPALTPPPKASAAPASPESTATAAPLEAFGRQLPCGSAAGMVFVALALFAGRRFRSGD